MSLVSTSKITVPEGVSFLNTLYERASNHFGFPSNAISRRESTSECSKLCPNSVTCSGSIFVTKEVLNNGFANMLKFLKATQLVAPTTRTWSMVNLCVNEGRLPQQDISNSFLTNLAYAHASAYVKIYFFHFPILHFQGSPFSTCQECYKIINFEDRSSEFVKEFNRNTILLEIGNTALQ
jgi:hypothetical protein